MDWPRSPLGDSGGLAASLSFPFQTWEESLQGCLSGRVQYQFVVHAPE